MPQLYNVPEGLRRSWVDRARVVTREATGAKVRGTTTYAPVAGPWFACRLLTTDTAPENRGQRGRVMVVQGPQLSFSLVSLDGTQDIMLGMEDELEVESNQEGADRWQVTSQPMIIRKLEELLGGGLCTVRRVIEPTQH